MSTIDKATQMIECFLPQLTGELGKRQAERTARALANAGLLAPDLPQPDSDGPGHIVEWHPVARYPEAIIWTKPQAGRVMVQQVEPGDLTPEETVAFAHAVLAAANTAERNTLMIDLPPSNDVRYLIHNDYLCAVLMGPFSINGYVLLPDGHPWLSEGDLERHSGIDVHGGITYHRGRTIGFDTNHAGDGNELVAKSELVSMFSGRTWGWDEVEAETRRLAAQAKNAEISTRGGGE